MVAASYDEFALTVLEKAATHKVVKEKRYAELRKVAGDPNDDIINSFYNLSQTLNDNHEKQKKLTSIYLEGGIALRGDSLVLDKDKIAGMTEKEAKEYFAGFPSIKEAEIKFSPFWVKKIPTLQDHIKINIEY